ncbi:hypothetical protein DV737_g3604, partial [Chaetothyriales sp. CBS 132003]
MMETTGDTAMLDPTMYNNVNLDHFLDGIPMDSMDSLMNPGTRQPSEDGRGNPGGSSSSNANMSGVGAGPLPAEFGISVLYQPSGTLTEFTKRRNWSQRLLEELKDLLYILTPDGRLLYVSPSSKSLTGYEQGQLIGKFIFDFIHGDDSSLFIREFNESITSGNPLRFFYRFRTAENRYTIFECHGHPHLTNNISHLEATGGPVNGAGFCRGFFMMARPCPTSNSQLLDSFLEHKLENVRLQARIAALKREEAEEAELTAKHYHKKAGGTTPFSRTESSDLGHGSSSQASRGAESNDFHGGMPPPAKPTKSNIALTREALDQANAFARPDSITDKMARYEGSSHVDSIEMLTGLRYREGERSRGISTGGKSPALIRGDAGIDIPAEKTDPRYSSTSHADRKPKKVKSADEFVCTDCGTLDSPEWRRGPNGPKTLCNACGLRWAKKEKKKTSGEEGPKSAVNGGGPVPTTATGTVAGTVAGTVTTTATMNNNNDNKNEVRNQSCLGWPSTANQT